MKGGSRERNSRSEEPGELGSSEPVAKGSSSRRYGVEESRRLLAERGRRGETMARICARHRVCAESHSPGVIAQSATRSVTAPCYSARPRCDGAARRRALSIP